VPIIRLALAAAINFESVGVKRLDFMKSVPFKAPAFFAVRMHRPMQENGGDGVLSRSGQKMECGLV
jgi:hypothetical protein